MHPIYGASEMRLGERRSTNPLRIPHPKIDKLACQAQGVGILAKGAITLRKRGATVCILKITRSL